MKLQISIIPKEIIEAYNLYNIQYNNGWVYMKIYKGVYGLKQAGIISNLEVKRLVVILFTSQTVFLSMKPTAPSSY